MTRTKRFLYGVGWGYLNQFVMAAVGIYLTRYYLARLGSPHYGLWLVGLQILAYLSLLDLGVVALLPRETAYALGRNDKSIPRLFAETLSLTLWQAPLLAAACFIALGRLPSEWGDLRGPLTITLWAFVLLFPLRTFSAVLQGVQDFKFLGLAQFLSWGLGTLTAIAGIWTGVGLYSLALAWIVTQLTIAVLAGYRLVTRHPSLLPSRLTNPGLRRAAARLKKSLWITLSQISQVLLVGTDVIIVGKLLGPEMVVLFTCSNKLIQILLNQPQLITQAAMPGLAELKSGRDSAVLKRVTESLTLTVMILSGAIVVVVLAVNQGFVTWWVGPSNYAGNLLTALLLANMCLRHAGTAIVYSLFSFGHEKALAFIGIGDGLVTLAIGLGLTPWWGLKGVVAGSFVGAIFVALPLCARLLAQDLEISLWKLVEPLLGWAWRFVTMGVVSAGVLLSRPPSGPWGVLSASLVLSTVYGLVMVPVVRRSPLGDYVEPYWGRARSTLRKLG